LSALRHVTRSPWLIVKLDGVNDVLLIRTVTLAAEPAAGAASAAAATSMGTSNLRISGLPPPNDSRMFFPAA
jgi:hypothetical protein